MHVEMRPRGSITPYDNNPKRNDGAIEAVAACIREYGVSDDERWVPVPGYEGLYEVSSLGRARRASKSRMAPAGHVLRPRVTKAGYLQYGLCRRRRYWHVTGHRLVALAFLGPPPFPGAHVAHYDGDKSNNRLSNLRWATPAENEADKRRHGRQIGARPGEQHHGAKLTAEVVRALRRQAASRLSVAAVARRFGVAMLTAYDAVVGNTWKTVTEPPPLPRRGKGGVS